MKRNRRGRKTIANWKVCALSFLETNYLLLGEPSATVCKALRQALRELQLQLIPIRESALSDAANSNSSHRHAVAAAQAVPVRSCALNSPRRGRAALATAAKSISSERSAVANAHTLFVRVTACSVSSRWPSVAKAQTTH